MTVAINLLEQKQLIILLKTFILLYFFIGEGVIADKGGGSYVYNLRSEMLFTFNKISISIIISGEYLKEYYSSTLYTARFKNLDIIVKTPLMTQNLGKCIQYSGMKAITEPFVVNLQKSGQFKSLTVAIGEQSFAVNLKYLLATLFQVNSTAIVDSNETLQQIKSRLIFGNCKVYYHGPIKTPSDKIYEKVVSYGSDCDDLNKGLGKHDEKFLASMKCKRNGEEKSQWNGTGLIRIMLNGNNIPIITEYNLTDTATSEPFKNSKQKLKLEIHTTTTMINFDPELSVPQRTVNTNTFSRVLYSPVDRYDNVVDVNVHKALACVYNVDLNPFIKMIETAEGCRRL